MARAKTVESAAKIRQQFAVRFVPPSDRARVPLDTYLGALAAVRDGLASTRLAFAQRIADTRHWPIQAIRQSLNIEVRPVEKGSLVTPFDVGAPDEEQIPIAYSGLPEEYWQYTCDALEGASAGTSPTKISASGAESFVRAAEIAKVGKCSIHLAQREAGTRVGRWLVAANLSQMSKRLGDYVRAQRVTTRTSTTIVGRVTDMSFDQPSFRVQTKNRHVSIRARAHQRKEIQDAWGEEVVVDVSACIDADGSISDAVAISVRVAPADPLADFEQSYGSGADAWSSPEGQRFLQTMRGGA